MTEPSTRCSTAAPGVGIYWDRNNSLLLSATTSPAENVLSLNVYPGVLPGLGKQLGLWAVRTRRDEWRFGVVHRQALGLGVGFGR